MGWIWLPIQCRKCHEYEEEQRAKIAANDAIMDWEKRLKASGLPAVYRNGLRTFADIPRYDAEQIAASLEASGGVSPGLYLFGPPGTFKTSVAAAFLRSQIDKGGSGKYVFVPDLMDEIYAVYAGEDGDASVMRIVRSYAEIPMLVLDDLGKEKRSEHSASILFRLLDGRYRNPKRGGWLLITSNDTLTTLTAQYAAVCGTDHALALERRIAEMTQPVDLGADRT